MLHHATIEINAPAATVWAVFSDVQHWPEWTASVTRLAALDGSDLAVGSRFAIKQPRLPEARWQVTEVRPGLGWTWAQRVPGGSILARHDVVPLTENVTRVDQRIEQRGPVGQLVGLVARGLTSRYLDMEAHGLKAKSEEIHGTHT